MTAVVDAVATHDDDGGEIVVFAITPHQTEGVALEVGLRAFPRLPGHRATGMADDDVRAANTEDQQER